MADKRFMNAIIFSDGVCISVHSSKDTSDAFSATFSFRCFIDLTRTADTKYLTNLIEEKLSEKLIGLTVESGNIYLREREGVPTYNSGRYTHQDTLGGTWQQK